MAVNLADQKAWWTADWKVVQKVPHSVEMLEHQKAARMVAPRAYYSVDQKVSQLVGLTACPKAARTAVPKVFLSVHCLADPTVFW